MQVFLAGEFYLVPQSVLIRVSLADPEKQIKRKMVVVLWF
jgi:hypothetical protein